MNAYEEQNTALIKAYTLLSIATFDEGTKLDEVERIKAEVKDAIRTPPRNCDVGTAEEQLKRFKDFCRTISKDKTCVRCPRLRQCLTLEHCTLEWAQMPYEEVKE